METPKTKLLSTKESKPHSIMEQKARKWQSYKKPTYKIPAFLGRDETLVLIGELQNEIAFLVNEANEIRDLLRPIEARRLLLLKKKWKLQESITTVHKITKLEVKKHNDEVEEIRQLKLAILDAKRRGIGKESDYANVNL